MSEDDRIKVLMEMVAFQYESMGFVVLEIGPFAPGMFKMDVIENEMAKEILVTVLLHGAYVNGIDKR